MRPIPVIFAPGLMCDGRLFAAQVAALQEDRRVAVADLSRDRTIAAMARRLLANAPERFALAGLSMGGIVSFEVWRQAPFRVAGLALMNTTAFPDSPARRRTRLSHMARVEEGQLRAVVMEELKPNYLGPASRDDEAVLELIYRMAEDLGPDVFGRQSEALMGRIDSAPTLRTIRCPTVVVAGDQDAICPPDLHEIICDGVDEATLHILGNCGHLSTLEAGDAVTEILKGFLAEIDEREGKKK